MWPALAPIQALASEVPPRAARRIDIDAERREESIAARSHAVRALIVRRDRAACDQRLGHRDAQAPRKVVVARARRAQVDGDARLGQCGDGRRRRDDGERLDRACDVGAGEPEQALPSGDANSEQPARDELAEMRARGVRGEGRAQRQLPRRALLSAEQRQQHRRARGFADQRRHLGNPGIGRTYPLPSHPAFEYSASTFHPPVNYAEAIVDDMITAPLDPVAAATHPDPYPYYARLAEEVDLTHHASAGLWIAANAPLVEAVFRHESARVRPPGKPVPDAIAGTATGTLFASFARTNDGERHRAARPPLEAAIAGLTAALERHAGDRAAALAATLDVAGDTNALDAFIERFPVYVLAASLGCSEAAQPDIFTAIRAFARAVAPGASPQELAGGAVASRELIDRFGERSNDIAILFQSYDGTRGAIGSTLSALSQHPEFAAAIEREPSFAVRVVEEALRYDSPVQNTRRYFADDATFAGAHLRAGDTVLLVLAAANRDPRVNPDPARFDPSRKASRWYTFGIGTHACPGKAAAVAIAASAVRFLLARGLDVETLRVARYRPALNVRIPLFGGA